MRRSLVPGFVFLANLAWVSMASAAPTPGAAVEKGGVPPGPIGTAGIRLTVSNVDASMRSADLDLTMYTRGYGPYGTTSGGDYVAYAGSPFFGYPAIDYGDGSTVPTVTLALTNSGGGPGGSFVYRSLASFSHTYPSPGAFLARASMACIGCIQVSYVFFPMGSPAPATFTGSLDLRPTNVIGNQPLRLYYTGTSSSSYFGSSVRYSTVVSPVVTTAAPVVFTSQIPTVSQWGLIALGGSLLGMGLAMMRRRRAV